MRVVIFCTGLLCFFFGSLDEVTGQWMNFRLFMETTDKNLTLPPPRVSQQQIKTFEQKLDHFSRISSVTFAQRYIVQDKYYKPGGPVFFLLGGETVMPMHMAEDTSSIMTIAQKFNAIVYLLEHRYYGESLPFRNPETSQLVYLSSEQALADAAYFRAIMGSKNAAIDRAPWVVFGCSYAGSLATWFKLKYPQLVVGAVASSAPLKAVVNFKAYMNLVAKAVKTVSQSCYDHFGTAITILQKELASKTQGAWENVSKVAKTCEPFDGSDVRNEATLLSKIIYFIAGYVQNHKQGTTVSIERACRLIEAQQGNSLEKLVAVLTSSQPHCLGANFKQLIEQVKNSMPSEHMWFYQVCTEFGFMQTSESKKQLFGDSLPLEFLISHCSELFGEDFDRKRIEEGVRRTNIKYGCACAKLHNVTFVHGSVDPWQILGMTKDITSDVRTIYVEGESHCPDWTTVSPYDSQALVDARQRIQEHVAKWIESK